ncbi:MAG: MurR/RpiR family transcriptional regulator [Erysipelotrichaceae bacterium]
MDPINSILHFINTESHESTNYIISKFIIENVKIIPTTNITDFAVATNVSPATITRYIKHLNLDNYSDFKNFFKTLLNANRSSFLRMDQFQLDKIIIDPQEFLLQYADEICEAIKDSARNIKIDDVKYLNKRIFNSDNIAILGYGDANLIAKDIQLGYIFFNKVIHCADSYDKLNDIIQTFNNKSLIIVISNYGNFFNHYRQQYLQMIKKKIPIICITQNFQSMDVFAFEKTIYLSSIRNLKAGNYPFRLFSDFYVRYLLNNYTK